MRLVATSHVNNTLFVLVCSSSRYMKFATAVYGDAMIRAAEMDVKGKLDPRIMPVTKTRISEHCSIAEDDIVVLDVDYKGDVRMFVHSFVTHLQYRSMNQLVNAKISHSHVFLTLSNTEQALETFSGLGSRESQDRSGNSGYILVF